MCLCVPFVRRSPRFSVRVSPILSYILCYPYFGTFLSTWSLIKMWFTDELYLGHQVFAKVIITGNQPGQQGQPIMLASSQAGETLTSGQPIKIISGGGGQGTVSLLGSPTKAITLAQAQQLGLISPTKLQQILPSSPSKQVSNLGTYGRYVFLPYVRLINYLHIFLSSAFSFTSQYLLLFLKSWRRCVLSYFFHFCNLSFNGIMMEAISSQNMTDPIGFSRIL